MSYRVQQVPHAHVPGLAKLLELAVTPNARAIGAYGPDGALRGFVLYDDWTPNSVHMHVGLASPMAARALLSHAFRFPFVEGKREVALGVIREGNKRSQRLAVGLGFQLTHRIADGWAPGEDLLVYEYRRDAWAESERQAA